MTVHLSDNLADALKRLAQEQGKGMDRVVEEAVKDYLTAAAITDISTDDLAATQASLLPELDRVMGCNPYGRVEEDEAS